MAKMICGSDRKGHPQCEGCSHRVVHDSNENCYMECYLSNCSRCVEIPEEPTFMYAVENTKGNFYSSYTNLKDLYEGLTFWVLNPTVVVGDRIKKLSLQNLAILNDGYTVIIADAVTSQNFLIKKVDIK